MYKTVAVHYSKAVLFVGVGFVRSWILNAQTGILNGTNELEVKDLAILISERKGMVLSKIPKDADCPEPLLVIAGKATGE